MKRLWGRRLKKQENVLLDLTRAIRRRNRMTVAARITEKLTEAFAPSQLLVEDESARHAGHAGARPQGETHFRVRIVADVFASMNRVERPRRVYAVLADELRGPVHALALSAEAPGERS
jgi:BolA protein